jgi:hypothetical protein
MNRFPDFPNTPTASPSAGLALRRRTDAMEGEITLPEGVDGAFVWKGRTQLLVPGANALA